MFRTVVGGYLYLCSSLVLVLGLEDAEKIDWETVEVYFTPKLITKCKEIKYAWESRFFGTVIHEIVMIAGAKSEENAYRNKWTGEKRDSSIMSDLAGCNEIADAVLKANSCLLNHPTDCLFNSVDKKMYGQPEIANTFFQHKIKAPPLLKDLLISAMKYAFHHESVIQRNKLPRTFTIRDLNEQVKDLDSKLKSERINEPMSVLDASKVRLNNILLGVPVENTDDSENLYEYKVSFAGEEPEAYIMTQKIRSFLAMKALSKVNKLDLGKTVLNFDAFDLIKIQMKLMSIEIGTRVQNKLAWVLKKSVSFPEDKASFDVIYDTKLISEQKFYPFQEAKKEYKDRETVVYIDPKAERLSTESKDCISSEIEGNVPENSDMIWIQGITNAVAEHLEQPHRSARSQSTLQKSHWDQSRVAEAIKAYSVDQENLPVQVDDVNNKVATPESSEIQSEIVEFQLVVQESPNDQVLNFETQSSVHEFPINKVETVGNRPAVQEILTAQFENFKTQPIEQEGPIVQSKIIKTHPIEHEVHIDQLAKVKTQGSEQGSPVDPLTYENHPAVHKSPLNQIFKAESQSAEQKNPIDKVETVETQAVEQESPVGLVETGKTESTEQVCLIEQEDKIETYLSMQESPIDQLDIIETQPNVQESPIDQFETVKIQTTEQESLINHQETFSAQPTGHQRLVKQAETVETQVAEQEKTIDQINLVETQLIRQRDLIDQLEANIVQPTIQESSDDQSETIETQPTVLDNPVDQLETIKFQPTEQESPIDQVETFEIQVTEQKNPIYQLETIKVRPLVLECPLNHSETVEIQPAEQESPNGKPKTVKASPAGQESFFFQVETVETQVAELEKHINQVNLVRTQFAWQQEYINQLETIETQPTVLESPVDQLETIKVQPAEQKSLIEQVETAKTQPIEQENLIDLIGTVGLQIATPKNPVDQLETIQIQSAEQERPLEQVETLNFQPKEQESPLEQVETIKTKTTAQERPIKQVETVVVENQPAAQINTNNQRRKPQLQSEGQESHINQNEINKIVNIVQENLKHTIELSTRGDNSNTSTDQNNFPIRSNYRRDNNPSSKLKISFSNILDLIHPYTALKKGSKWAQKVSLVVSQAFCFTFSKILAIISMNISGFLNAVHYVVSKTLAINSTAVFMVQILLSFIFCKVKSLIRKIKSLIQRVIKYLVNRINAVICRSRSLFQKVIYFIYCKSKALVQNYICPVLIKTYNKVSWLAEKSTEVYNRTGETIESYLPFRMHKRPLLILISVTLLGSILRIYCSSSNLQNFMSLDDRKYFNQLLEPRALERFTFSRKYTSQKAFKSFTNPKGSFFTAISGMYRDAVMIYKEVVKSDRPVQKHELIYRLARNVIKQCKSEAENQQSKLEVLAFLKNKLLETWNPFSNRAEFYSLKNFLSYVWKNFDQQESKDLLNVAAQVCSFEWRQSSCLYIFSRIRNLVAMSLWELREFEIKNAVGVWTKATRFWLAVAGYVPYLN